MPVKIENRRQTPRSLLPEFLGAEIEFRVPDGSSCMARLLELSVEGGGFSIPTRIPDLRPGRTLEGATIRVGQIEIGVNLVVQNVTRSGGTSFRCGVRVFPRTDDDRNEFLAMVARLESLPR